MHVCMLNPFNADYAFLCINSSKHGSANLDRFGDSWFKKLLSIVKARVQGFLDYLNSLCSSCILLYVSMNFKNPYKN